MIPQLNMSKITRETAGPSSTTPRPLSASGNVGGASTGRSVTFSPRGRATGGRRLSTSSGTTPLHSPRSGGSLTRRANTAEISAYLDFDVTHCSDVALLQKHLLETAEKLMMLESWYDAQLQERSSFYHHRLSALTAALLAPPEPPGSPGSGKDCFVSAPIARPRTAGAGGGRPRTQSPSERMYVRRQPLTSSHRRGSNASNDSLQLQSRWRQSPSGGTPVRHATPVSLGSTVASNPLDEAANNNNNNNINNNNGGGGGSGYYGFYVDRKKVSRGSAVRPLRVTTRGSAGTPLRHQPQSAQQQQLVGGDTEDNSSHHHTPVNRLILGDGAAADDDNEFA